jgi:hypothetical protein
VASAAGDAPLTDCPGCGAPLPHHDAKCQYRGLDAAEIRQAMGETSGTGPIRLVGDDIVMPWWVKPPAR